MKIYNICILLTLFSLTSCSTTTNNSSTIDNSSSNTISSFEETSSEQIIEQLIPNEIINADLEIDILINKQMDGLGSFYDIGSYDKPIKSIEIIRYFAAAKEFKKIAKDVKINLFTDINIGTYKQSKSHIPHLMVYYDNPTDYIKYGYATDLSRYSNTHYFKSFNSNLINSLNYGGFQAALPLQIEPYGLYVNLDYLKEGKVVENVLNNGVCTKEYKDFVDNFTFDNFIDAVIKTNTTNHAGLDYLNSIIVNHSLENINYSMIKNKSIDLTSEEVISDITKLLESENELSKYCLYEYGYKGLKYKSQFNNAASWLKKENFIKDKYSTFSAEFPWSFSHISNFTKDNNVNINLDYLPYPKFNNNSQFNSLYTTSISVGNLCPIGSDGNEKCYSSTAKLEMDVAAYFSMFMSLDPRVYNSYYNMTDINNKKPIPLLPLINKNISFDFDENIKTYENIFNYQLELYLKENDLFITDNNSPDIINFSNIKYGFAKLLEIIYNENSTTLYINNVPSINEINWSNRYSKYSDKDTFEGYVGTTSYVSTILKNLSAIETDFNNQIISNWQTIQNGLDKYYGLNSYKVI